MPRGDGTGPMGRGPLTGRGAGYCAGYGAPGYANGGGFYGRPRFGRGFRRWYAPATPWYGPAYAPVAGRDDERDMLASQAEVLKDRLDQINKRLSDLESKAAE